MDHVPGTVARLWRWPVKSMAGERVDALRVDHRGAGGDRTHAVLHEHKGARKPLTAREAPRLLAWHAAYPLDGALDPQQPPLATVTAPDGQRYRWDDARLPGALESDLGRPVWLERDVAGIQDLANTLLVTTQATLDALGEELGGAIDLRRFRPNLHLDIDAPGLGRARLGGCRAGVRGRRPAAVPAPVRALRDPHARPGHAGQVAAAAQAPDRRARHVLRDQRARAHRRPGGRRRADRAKAAQ